MQAASVRATESFAQPPVMTTVVVTETAYAGYQIIRRNGAVVSFEPNRALAMKGDAERCHVRGHVRGVREQREASGEETRHHLDHEGFLRAGLSRAEGAGVDLRVDQQADQDGRGQDGPQDLDAHVLARNPRLTRPAHASVG